MNFLRILFAVALCALLTACNSNPLKGAEKVEPEVIQKAPYDDMTPSQRVTWQESEYRVNSLVQDGEIRKSQAKVVKKTVESNALEPKNVGDLFKFAKGTTDARKALD